jgi:hypothetical protein
MKLCKNCKANKPMEEFSAGRAQCKPCRKIKFQNWAKINKNKIQQFNKLKWQKMKQDPAAVSKRKEWYEKNKSSMLIQKKEYYRINKQKILLCHKAYERMKLKTDPIFRLQKNLRRRLNLALKDVFKDETTMKLIGCNLIELKTHLQNSFKEGMSWENYGKWHIDHIKPISSFNLKNPKNQKLAMHYTNLQPLWAKDNMSKGDKILSD